MESDKLQNILKNLHEEIKGIDTVDDTSREMLDKLSKDIKKILDKDKEAETEEKKNLLETLEESAEHFDAAYPQLAESINIVIHTLSNMGI